MVWLATTRRSIICPLEGFHTFAIARPHPYYTQLCVYYSMGNSIFFYICDNLLSTMLKFPAMQLQEHGYIHVIVSLVSVAVANIV